MHSELFFRAIAVAALLFVRVDVQQGVATNSPVPLSTRVVAYTIDAQVDIPRHTLEASESLTYRNLTGQPLTQFPFHLYLNAFQPQSTYSSERHFGGGIRGVGDDADVDDAKKYGSITVTGLEADGFGKLEMRFAAPDDGNANDRTVAMVSLPRALAAGDSVTFHMHFRDVFPESVDRNGYKRDFLMGGQWFPKVGVFWHGQWNCHQYHATTEFFSDFGTYAVRLTLPGNYTVGASGVPTGDMSNRDGTRTLSYYGEDIHDFAFAASPHFNVMTRTYFSSMGPVQVRVLALQAHPKAGARYMSILMNSLREFEARYGPYPYKILTLVDPEPDSEIGGMEYPTLVTGDSSLFDWTLEQEVTAEHEFGHQYWYGMVATNEFEEAWLDEGINSYTEATVTGAILGNQTNLIRYPFMNESDASAHYLEYIETPNYDPVTRPAWMFHNSLSYGGVTYGKSSTLLRTLEGIVGKDVMDEAMRTYFMRFRFTHPTTEDFLRSIEEVAYARGRITGTIAPDAIPLNVARQMDIYYKSGKPADYPVGQLTDIRIMGSSLRPFLNQAVYGTAVLDYAVDKIVNADANWQGSGAGTGLNIDRVTVHRVGDFQLPVEVEIVFSDGIRRRERWDSASDSNDRWHTFQYVTAATVVSAEIDPGHTMLLDVDRFNNSRVVQANPVPARKVANVWVTAMQLGSQMLGYLI